MITAGTAGLVLLGCALFFIGRSGAEVEVQYGAVLADRNDVRTIRQIVSHERWVALGRAIRCRDVTSFKNSVRQLAFGRLRQVAGTWWGGSPAAVAYFEDTRNPSRSVEYALYYRKSHWRFAGCSYYDPNDQRLPKGALKFP